MNEERRALWLRGVLDLCVLETLTGGEMYGYELARHLDEAGLGRIKGGTLYPLLARLEKAAYVESQWRAGRQGPGRKYYSLTQSGRRHLKQQVGSWNEFTGLIRQLLQTEEGTK